MCNRRRTLKQLFEDQSSLKTSNTILNMCYAQELGSILKVWFFNSKYPHFHTAAYVLWAASFLGWLYIDNVNIPN